MDLVCYTSTVYTKSYIPALCFDVTECFGGESSARVECECVQLLCQKCNCAIIFHLLVDATEQNKTTAIRGVARQVQSVN